MINRDNLYSGYTGAIYLSSFYSQQHCPPTAKGPNWHIDYFEIIGIYCTWLPLTCTLKTNLDIVIRGFRTLNQDVL